VANALILMTTAVDGGPHFSQSNCSFSLMAAVDLTEDSEQGPEMWAILIHDGLFVP